MRLLDRVDLHTGKVLAVVTGTLAWAKIHITPDASEKIAHTLVLLLTGLIAGTAFYHKYVGHKARYNRKSRPGSILIVDDSEPDCILFSLEFQKLKCTVTCVSTHHEAKRLLYSNGYHYDLAMIDIKMPGEDLLDLFQYVKREQPQIDVLMMSGNVTTTTIEKISRHGYCLFLQKPEGNITGFAQYVVNSFKLNR